MPDPAHFLAQFRARQEARGRDLGPLFEQFAPPALPPVEVEAAPLAPEAPTARPDPEDVPTARVCGASPLMRDVYDDLRAVADRVAARSLKGVQLSSGARRLYELLVLLGLGNARARGLSAAPTVAEYHMPLELLSLVMKVDRVTVWRWAKELGEQVNEETGEVTGAQLAVYQDHKTSSIPAGALEAVAGTQERRKKAGGKAAREGVSDGAVWAVSLNGARPGLRVSGEAMRHEWRDLLADAIAASKNKGSAAGLRTVWALKNRGLQQSLNDLRANEGEEILVRWTVNPGFSATPPLNMTVARPAGGTLSAVWDVLAVRSLPLRERGAAVEAAAQFLAVEMNDPGSVGLYQWVLWRLCRLTVVGVELWDAVLLLLDQVRGDLVAGDANKAGAVVMWRLQKAGLWTTLKEAPQVRVGKWASA